MKGREIREELLWEGRRLTLTWLPRVRETPHIPVTQASGLLFTEDGLIVLVAADDAGWTLPGGHPEPGESLEEALRREVREEACAELLDCLLLGVQRVDDPAAPSGPRRYDQARFWGRVRLDDFAPAFETRYRTAVFPADFRATLAWGASPIAGALLEAALARQNRQQPLSGSRCA